MVGRLIPPTESIIHAAANAYDMILGGGVADLRPTPARIIDEAPKRTIYEYLAPEPPRDLPPVMLVPPLAASARCFDLHRGCSLAAHMLAAGRPTYLVEYGAISFADRELGLEHWVLDVVPSAVRIVSERNGGRPVQLVGWCLGGIMSALATAADEELPVASLALIASPFDFSRVPLFQPLRAIANVADGAAGTAIYRVLGGAPAPIVRQVFRLLSLDKYLVKPVATLANLHDRDYLAQQEAVDNFIDNMHAYPGRTIGQLYHRLFRENDLASGRIELAGRALDLADVRVPVLAVAGEDDNLAPPAAVHHVAELLTGAPEVRTETAPGGHLGVLTGRSAAGTTWRHLDRHLDDSGRLASATEPRRPASRRGAVAGSAVA